MSKSVTFYLDEFHSNIPKEMASIYVVTRFCIIHMASRNKQKFNIIFAMTLTWSRVTIESLFMHGILLYLRAKWYHFNNTILPSCNERWLMPRHVLKMRNFFIQLICSVDVLQQSLVSKSICSKCSWIWIFEKIVMRQVNELGLWFYFMDFLGLLKSQMFHFWTMIRLYNP